MRAGISSHHTPLLTRPLQTPHVPSLFVGGLFTNFVVAEFSEVQMQDPAYPRSNTYGRLSPRPLYAGPSIHFVFASPVKGRILVQTS